MSRSAAESARTARLISASEAADRLGRTPATLRNWRWRGEGPAFVRFGNRVHYTEDALVRWIDQHEVNPEGAGS